MLLKIANGTIVDPRNHPTRYVGDLWVLGGTIIPPPQIKQQPDQIIDASGMIVMPGGVDMHAHIAGPKVNYARKLRPERQRLQPRVAQGLQRSGTAGVTPTTFTTGYLYAGLGYTTVFDAAVPALGARHAHEEFHDTPAIDKGCFILAGNNTYAMKLIQERRPEELTSYLGWLLQATYGYALKVVNPGGVENWKLGWAHQTVLDSVVEGYGITPRDIIQQISGAADRLQLPHPMHLHCNQLGLPGNWQTTLQTMQALEGSRAHLTHIQFHSYGGEPDDQSTFCSRVPDLVAYVNDHPNLSIDVGHVVFGHTTSMTGDGPLGNYLHQVTGNKWFNSETECEAGCGIVPIVYREKSTVHALQWAIGVEWYLLMQDPWRIAMSTDHPNGGSFTAYPEMIAVLMDLAYRKEVLARLPEAIRGKSCIHDLDRVYSFEEIAIITRAAPAKLLGLPNKGHLGWGADGDITIYQPQANIKSMFEAPRYVIKSGAVIINHGEYVREYFGKTIHVQPTFQTDFLQEFTPWFANNYSLSLANYPVTSDYLPHGTIPVKCG
ncbi:MAG: formylmethanofuran dehydrogenase subunit A [Zavarzinella sp.]